MQPTRPDCPQQGRASGSRSFIGQGICGRVGRSPPAAGSDSTTHAQFAEWVRYEDEFVSFSYPKDARVSLEIKSPGDPIPILGSPVSSSENSLFRCYRLTFNGATYCLLLLDRTNDFDDGVCFCGHVAYEKYLEHHEALYRFSLFDNGVFKKIQMLGTDCGWCYSSGLICPLRNKSMRRSH